MEVGGVDRDERKIRECGGVRGSIILSMCEIAK